MRVRFAAFLFLVLALGPGCPSRGESRGGNPRLAPIDAREAKSTHGPYAQGACEACHERHGAADPGRAVKTSNASCVDCHEEFAVGTAVRLDHSTHPVNDAPCTGCHNPHNARKPKLQM
jgi:predicted CXXCH cytochrome family protein